MSEGNMKKSSPISIVIATHNKGKTVEIRDLLEGFPIRIKNLDDFGPIPPVEEDGETFEENAYKKASFTARVLGLPALADDSGLLVDALVGTEDKRKCEGSANEAQDHCRINRQSADVCLPRHGRLDRATQ